MESNKTFWIIMIVVVSMLITMLTASRPITITPKAPTDSISSLTNLSNKSSLSPKLKTICSKTDYPELCESSIRPLITADFKPDVTSVLILAIEASINETKASLTTVGKAAAAECQELYDDAVSNLEDAITAVKSRDNPTVNSDLSAGMTYYGTCNDGFDEAGKPNPFVGVSDKLTKMVSNCLAISTLIK